MVKLFRDKLAQRGARGILGMQRIMRQAMGRAGRLRAETEFSNEIVCAQTLDLYRKLMEQ